MLTRTRIIVITVVLVLAAILWLTFGDRRFEDGVAAANQGDYETALYLLRPLAEKGNARAQNMLGVMYGLGWGVAPDVAQATNWYRKAAMQGYANAQYTLGVMYAEGRGVPKDDAQAMEWYRKAAKQGHTDAQWNLGFMYAEGRSSPQDYEQEMYLYRKAAKRGDIMAQYNVGVIYAEGRGVPQDYVQAYMRLSLATRRLPRENSNYQKMTQELYDIVPKMTQAQLAEAQRLAGHWEAEAN